MTRPTRCTAVGTLASVAGCLTALLVSAPTPHTALHTLADATSSADPTGPVVAGVALAAWATAGWLLLTVVVVLGAQVPGLVGQAGRAVAARLAPAAVRRVVEAALGLTVAVGALAPAAALAAPSAGPSPAVAGATATAEAAWDLDWPASSAPPRPDVRRPTAVATAPTATSQATRRTATPRTPPARTAPAGPAAPSVTPRSVGPSAAVPPAGAPPAAPPVVRPSAATPTTGAVVVRTGDSLWSLAEAALRSAGTATPSDRQVAQAWPRWWAANREVIGDDPDLLLPDTVLRVPPSGTVQP